MQPNARSPIRPDGTREHIIVADVHGRFHRQRLRGFVVLLILGGALPWVRIGGNPALLIDLPGKRFCVFGQVFGAQDNGLLLALTLLLGLVLVSLTILLGRVYCGWACPQTVLLDLVFRPLERLAFGSRDKRLWRERQEQQGRRGAVVRRFKWARTLLSHALYAGAAAALAHGLATYFVDPHDLVRMIVEGPKSSPQAFVWVTAFTLLLYLDMSWFREQLCLIVCPYGRLQSVLLDADSLIVGYDERRGEPRGNRRRDPTAGDCVDCERCVAVCPTGIDIRNGLQLDCVACTACIDACDAVMTKMGRPVGLIRYDSQRGLAGGKTRWWRPRAIVFMALPVLLTAILAVSVGRRRDFAATVLRLPGVPFTREQGVVRNALQVHIVNQSTVERTFVVDPEALPDVHFILPLREVRVGAGAGFFVPLFVTMPQDRAAHELALTIRVRPGTSAAVGAASDHRDSGSGSDNARGGGGGSGSDSGREAASDTKVLRAMFIGPDR